MATTETPENLADLLARDLKPVRPLAPPSTRAAGAMLFALAVAGVAVFALGGPRADWAAMLQAPEDFGPLVAMLGAGIAAALAAFILAVPDVKMRRPVPALLALSTVLWVELCIATAFTLSPGEAGAALSDWAGESACARGLLLMTVLPLAAGFVLTLRGAPFWRGWSGYALTLSMASFAAAGMRFLCPSDAPGHLLLWHFVPVVVLAGIGTLAGKAVLRFK